MLVERRPADPGVRRGRRGETLVFNSPRRDATTATASRERSAVAVAAH